MKALAPLSCAKCFGRIDPGDEVEVVAGGNYHPAHSPDPVASVARPWVMASADLAASRWGGDAA